MTGATGAARTRPLLLCLHAAGTTSAMFDVLGSRLLTQAKIEAIDLPGRAASFGQPLLRDMDAAVRHFLPRLADLPHRGYAILGYSMGGLIGYELARQLWLSKGPLPAELIVAAARAPHIPARESPLHRMDDECLLAELVRFQGTAPELLKHRELMALVLPSLRKML